MTIEAMEWAWKQQMPSPDHKLVLLALADTSTLVHDGLISWDPELVPRIARMTRLSEERVAAISQDFKAMHLLA